MTDSPAYLIGRIIGSLLFFVVFVGVIVLVIWLIVRAVRRGKATPGVQPSSAGQLPPAGLYPDPERPGQERYWDGTAWANPPE